MDALVIDVATPVPLRVVCTVEQWRLLTTITQPLLASQLERIRSTLADPDEVRGSTRDPTMLMYYRRAGRQWMSVVVKRQHNEGFLISASPSEPVPTGSVVWTK